MSHWNESESEQTYIPGTEPPADPIRTPELDQRISAWLAARRAKLEVAADAKETQDRLLADVLAAGLDRYPYTDDKGKKRYFVPDTTARPKTIAAVSKDDKPKRGRRGRHKDVEIGEEVTADAGSDDRIEIRTVSRASVAAEIDPFASTRSAMTSDGADDSTVDASAQVARAKRKGGRR